MATHRSERRVLWSNTSKEASTKTISRLWVRRLFFSSSARMLNYDCPDTGVNFMEKTISVRKTTITFSIWDLGGVAHRDPRCALLTLYPNRSTRVCEHATACIQRRGGYSVHVRSHTQVDSELRQGVVSASARVQQGQYRVYSVCQNFIPTIHIFRPRSPSLSEPSTISSRPSLPTNKRKSRSRRSDLLKRCMHL